MADPIVDLIKRLHKRTLESRVRWEESAFSTAFLASFPGYSVQIFEDERDYHLKIFDSEGDLIEEISDEELSAFLGGGGAGYELLRAIYTSARRSARGADRAVQSILDSLGDDDDDDIPF